MKLINLSVLSTKAVRRVVTAQFRMLIAGVSFSLCLWPLPSSAAPKKGSQTRVQQLQAALVADQRLVAQCIYLRDSLRGLADRSGDASLREALWHAQNLVSRYQNEVNAIQQQLAVATASRVADRGTAVSQTGQITATATRVETTTDDGSNPAITEAQIAERRKYGGLYGWAPGSGSNPPAMAPARPYGSSESRPSNAAR